MKKTIVLLLTVMLVLSFAACKKPIVKEENTSSTTNNTTSDTTDNITKLSDGEAVEIENKVNLSIDKSSYEKEERIEVTLDISKLDKEAAVIVIAKSGAEHGNETVVHDNYEEYRYLADFSELPFYLWAPEYDGNFDVRIYATGDGGEELASISFTVGNVQ